MRRTTVVRLSSKGQIIIPASLRRRLGLRKGQPLEIRQGKGRKIVFVPLEEQPREVDAMLRQARAWFAKTGNDPLTELERRRRKEREIERKKILLTRNFLRLRQDFSPQRRGDAEKNLIFSASQRLCGEQATLSPNSPGSSRQCFRH